MNKRTIKIQLLAVSAIAMFFLHACKKDNDEAPTPFIGITIDNPIKTQPDTVNFIANSTIPCTFRWNFGDSSAEATGETVSHIFPIGYYYVTLNATSEANKTASVFKGINTSKYRRANISSILFTKLPALRTDGTNWDADGTNPDVYCKIITGTRSGTTAILMNTPVGNNLSLNLNFFPAFADSLFDQPLVIEVYNENESPAEDELMQTISINENLTNLMTNQEPYATFKEFENSSVAGRLTFVWVQ